MITTVLGIDYGKKRVGIAVGNTLTRSAEPLKIITRENDEQALNEIGTLIKEWQATELVIGIPRHPDDTPHEMTKACLKFAQRLREELQLTVHETDERMQLNELSLLIIFRNSIRLDFILKTYRYLNADFHKL